MKRIRELTGAAVGEGKRLGGSISEEDEDLDRGPCAVNSGDSTRLVTQWNKATSIS